MTRRTGGGSADEQQYSTTSDEGKVVRWKWVSVSDVRLVRSLA